MPATRSARDLVTIARLAATGDGASLAPVLARTTDPPDVLVARLARHTLIGPVLLALDAADAWPEVPAALGAALAPWRQREWPSPQRLLAAQTRIVAALNEAGVAVLALKGLCFSQRLYGGLGRRPQFDLDLLVRSRDFARARAVVRRGGADPAGYDSHSRTFRLDDGVTLDLHHRLTRAPAFTADEAACWRTAVDLSLDGVAVRTLSDEWALVQLLHAAFEDLGQGMAKLRQLMDSYLLIRLIDGAMDWDAFFEARRREAFDRVAVNVLALLTTLFDGAAEWPRLAAAVGRRAVVVLAGSTGDAHALLLAPRKHAGNLRWFASLYPGSMAAYLVWFWYHGFPANVSLAALARLGGAVPGLLGMPAPPRRGGV